MSTTRRTFVLASGATTLAAATVPIVARAAASEIRVGVMGCGGRGTSLAKSFAGQPNVRIAMLAEPDEKRLQSAADTVEKASKSRPQTVSDFRTMLDDKSIDVFICAAPNHWHAPATILACAAGKHVYVEKPCSHTPHEGELIVAAARKHRRLVQMGNQRRSAPKIREAMEHLHDGVIGRVYFAQSWYANDRPSIGVGNAGEPPMGLDFDLWQGPATRKPFRSTYLHYNWHWFWQWGNGELGNNGIHTIDLLRWGLGVTHPTKVTSAGGRYKFKDDQETPDTHIVSYDFPDGKTLTWEGFSCNQLPQQKAIECLFQGEKGSLATNSTGYTIYDNKGKELGKASGTSGDAAHIVNFLAAVRGDAKLNSEITEGATSTLLCHLGNIAHRVGRTLVCDPATGKIINDADAMKLWSKPYAMGWEPKVS
jgi:predicted dehydrogenase